MSERAAVTGPWGADRLLPRTSRLVVLGGSALLFVYLGQKIVSWRVFTGRSLDAQVFNEGSLTNRVIMLLLAALALPLILYNRDRLAVLLRRCGPLLLLVAWFFATMLWSDAPDLTMRRLIRYVLYFWIAVAVIVSVWRFESFAVALVALFGVLIVADCAVVALFPRVGSTPLGFAGIHDHKNAAGPFALVSAVALAGACLALEDWPRKLIASSLCAASLAFLILTQSKTSIALIPTVPFVLTLFLIGRRTGHQAVLFASVAAVLLSMSTTALALTDTSLDDLLRMIFHDPTLTGRTEIWALLVEKIRERPLLGFGWGAFWSNPTTANPIEASRASWLSQIKFLNEGHNGYLDLTLEAGLVGLLLSILVFVHCISTFMTLLRQSPPGSARSRFIATFACVVVLLLFCNMTESLLFVSGSEVSELFVFIYLAAQAQLALDRSTRVVTTRPVAIHQALQRTIS